MQQKTDEDKDARPYLEFRSCVGFGTVYFKNKIMQFILKKYNKNRIKI